MLIGRNALRARRVWRRERGILEQRLQSRVTVQLGLPEHLDLAGIEWQQVNTLQVKVVIRAAHRNERSHPRNALFEPRRVGMQRHQRRIARRHQRLLLRRREVVRQRHQALLVEIVAPARRLCCQLCVESDRMRQRLLAFLQERRHPAQPCRRRQCASPPRGIFFFE